MKWKSGWSGRWIILFTIIGLACVICCSGGGGGAGDDDDDDSPDAGISTYSIGGTVTGLNGELRLNNDYVSNNESMTVTNDGPFTFSHKLQSGAQYSVSIAEQPAGQTCKVSNASGLIDNSNVDNVEVSCSTTLSMNFALKGMYDKNISMVNGIVKHDDYLYVDENDGIGIFNISDPDNISLVGKYTRANEYICILGSTAFIADGENLHIVDITSPGTPQFLNAYDVEDSIFGIVADDNYLYLTTFDEQELLIIDVADTSNPTLKSSLKLNSLSMIMDVNNGKAFLGGYNTFKIVDVSDPTNPSLLADDTSLQDVNDIEVLNSHAYLVGPIVAQQDYGLSIFDISDATDPELISRKKTDGYAFDLEIIDNYAFISGGTIGLEIFNIENPEAPFEITHSGLDDMRLEGGIHEADYFYIYGYSGGRALISILDVSNPSSPNTLSTYSHFNRGKDFAFRGDDLFLSNEGDQDLQILDISDPENPDILGYSAPSHYFSTTNSLIIHGDYAYQSGEGSAIYNEGGLRLWDISDPAQPEVAKILSDSAIPNWVNAMTIDNNIAYLCAPNEGLGICEINDPDNPACIIFNSDPFESIYEFVVIGNKAYASGDHNLHIFDLSNPKNPLLLGSYGTDQLGSNFVVKGDHLYIIDDPIEVVDISTPTDPVLVGEYQGVGGNQAEVVENKLYVAGYGQLSVLDVSEPTLPSIIGKYDFVGNAVRVHVSDNLIYVLLESGGIRILEEI